MTREVTLKSIKNFLLAMLAAVSILIIGVNGLSELWLLIPGGILGRLAWKADAYDEAES